MKSRFNFKNSFTLRLEKRLQNNVCIHSDAEGCQYRALQKKVNEIGVPIYVTENGVADRKDDFKILIVFSKYLIYAQALKKVWTSEVILLELDGQL